MNRIIGYTIVALFVSATTAFAQQRSAKRGMGWDEANQQLTNAPLQKMAPGVSWIYNWGQTVQGSPTVIGQGDGKIAYAPMCWNGDFNETALRNYLTTHQGEVEFLLGFNEPNLTWNHGGSQMTPQQAANAWPKVKQIAKDFGLKLVAPALNFSGDQVSGRVWSPFEWYDEFFRLCTDTEIEYLAFHSYMNWYSAVNWVATEYFYTDKEDGNLMSATNKAQYPNLVKFLEDFKTANGHYPQMMLTEFCSWEGDKDGYVSSVNSQIDQMTQKIQKLEQSDLVAGYAWFMGNTTQAPTAYPYNSIFQSNTASSQLSELGQVYVYMSAFDKEKYYASGETVLAKDYVDASMDNQQVKVRPNSDTGSDVPLQIELQSGAWATYQVDIPETAVLTLNMRAKSEGDNNVRIYYDEFKSTRKIFDGTVASTANTWADREVVSTKNIPAGKHTIIIWNGSSTSLFLNSFQVSVPTGINTIVQSDNFLDKPSAERVQSDDDAVYDLSGRKVSNGKLSNGQMPKGIYIYKGKKVVVK